jgi:formate dehydrogenase iron-sulfur subunit
VGGSNVLYLSNIDLGFLGWKPDLGDESMPATTWPALKIVPGVFLGMGAAMTGIWWFMERRNKVMAEEKPSEEAEEQ